MRKTLALRSMLLGLATATCITATEASAITIKQTAFYENDGTGGSFSNDFYKFNSLGIGQLQSVKLSWNLTFEWTATRRPWCDNPINHPTDTGCDEDIYSTGRGSAEVLGGDEFYVQSGDGLWFESFNGEVVFADGCGWEEGWELPQCQLGYGFSFFYEDFSETRSESLKTVGSQSPDLAPYLGVGILPGVLVIDFYEEGWGQDTRQIFGDSVYDSSGNISGKVSLIYKFRPLNLPEPSSAVVLALALLGAGAARILRRG